MPVQASPPADIVLIFSEFGGSSPKTTARRGLIKASGHPYLTPLTLIRWQWEGSLSRRSDGAPLGSGDALPYLPV